MSYLLSIFWFIRTSKVVLFYFYLWQLKEYHVARFIDHFRTYKGKTLFLNRIFILKLLMLIPFAFLLFSEGYLGRDFFISIIIGAVSLIYLLEVLSFFKNFFQKKLKKPVLTKKAGFLLLIGILIEILIFAFVLRLNIYSLVFWLLFFDVIFPFIISLIVLIIQPFVVLYRNEFILKKAKSKRLKFKKLKVIGITGSFGKTSTKEILSLILSEKFKVLKTKKHQNSEMGVSQCILQELNFEHEILIVEMGAYGKGGVKLLADIAKPEIGILTGINEQHLALFGSQKKIIKTKYELIESLPKTGLAVFNGENEYCSELYNMTKVEKRLYGTKESEVWAQDIKMDKESISFKVLSKDGQIADFKVNALGYAIVSNILGAIVVAKELGMNLEEIAQICLKITPEYGAMKLLKDKDDPFVLDASYSSNPDGVITDLDYLNTWENKKAIIMPCLIELGSASKEVHKRIGKKIGEVCDLAIITTKERYEELKAGAVESGMNEQDILFIEKPEEIMEHMQAFSGLGDTVLIAGRIPKEIINSL